MSWPESSPNTSGILDEHQLIAIPPRKYILFENLFQELFTYPSNAKPRQPYIMPVPFPRLSQYAPVKTIIAIFAIAFLLVLGYCTTLAPHCCDSETHPCQCHCHDAPYVEWPGNWHYCEPEWASHCCFSHFSVSFSIPF